MNAFVNGQPVNQPRGMSELPEAAGVFETVRWQDGQPEFWAEHWHRFKAGCRAFDLEPGVDSAAMLSLAGQLVAENALEAGVVRFAAWRGPAGGVEWRLEAGPPRPHMTLPELRVRRGPALPPADDLRAFKHLHRTPWLAALRAARADGFDEILLPDGAGRIVEGGVSNVFWVQAGILHTPSLGSGPLPGTIRARVLALAKTLGWEVQVHDASIEEVDRAEEVWLTNSLIGVRPVREIDGRPLPTQRPRLDALRRAWLAAYGRDPAQSAL